MRSMKRIMLGVLLSFSIGLMTACAPNVSPHTYQASESGVASKVLAGTIIGKRAVKVDANSGIGGLAGAGIGAAGGSAIGGSSRSNIAGAIGGAVLGGVVGNAVEKAIHSHKAFVYIINLKDGSTISITQVQELEFEVGQPVLIIYGATTRIVPDNTIRTVETPSAPVQKPHKPAIKKNKIVTRKIERPVEYNEI